MGLAVLALPIRRDSQMGGTVDLRVGMNNKFSGIFRKVSAPAVMAVALALNGFLNLATGVAGALSVVVRLGEVPEYLRLAPSRQFSGVLSVLLGLVLIVLLLPQLQRVTQCVS